MCGRGRETTFRVSWESDCGFLVRCSLAILWCWGFAWGAFRGSSACRRLGRRRIASIAACQAIAVHHEITRVGVKSWVSIEKL